MQKIFLWGLPGAGKSTLGRRLAGLIRLPFHDLDQYIESAEDRSISAIFENEGESHFRTLEHKYLFEVTSYVGPAIIATGGGTPCFENNLQLLKVSGRSLFLNAPIDLVYQRINTSSNLRPLFNNQTKTELKETLQNLYNERLLHYQKADKTINLTGEIEEDLNLIIPIVNKWLSV